MFTGSRQTVSIPIINDDVVEATEMFTVDLTSGSDDVTISGPSTATVTITDSDSKLTYLQRIVLSNHV